VGKLSKFFLNLLNMDTSGNLDASSSLQACEYLSYYYLTNIMLACCPIIPMPVADKDKQQLLDPCLRQL